MAGGANSDLYQRLTVTSILQRNLFQPRRWGMVITVTEGGTQNDYQLVYGAFDTDINNNDNWRAVDGAKFGTKTEYQTKVLTEHTGVIAAQSDLLSIDDIEDGESVTIEVPWTAKDDTTNTGAGGLFLTSWTKAGGTLNKVFDNNTLQSSDTGDAFTISTQATIIGIAIDISTPGPAGNYSVSWIARITQRKV